MLPARADISGFSGFQLNGGATVSGDNVTLTLTDGGGSEARSAFSPTAQSVGNFVVSYTYTDVSGGGADGFAFILQNDPRGTTALGAAGGSLGYSTITPSAAMTYNLYSGNGGSKSGYGTNGNHPYTPTGLVDITNTHPISVTYTYNGQTLTEKLTDSIAGTTNIKSYPLNLSADAGGSTAYVGFSGASGGVSSTQTISNFSFAAGAATAPVRAMSPIAATGYDRDVIIEASAVKDATTGYVGAITASVDGGDAKTGATLYETGLSGGTKGITTGSPLTSAADPNTTFLIQPATGNNAVQLNAAKTTGSLALSTPAAYSLLSVFAMTGGGSNLAGPMTIHFSNGHPDLVTTYYAPDWFNNARFAVSPLDRVNVGTGAFDNQAANPRIYQSTIDLEAMGVANDPISSIDFAWGGAGTTEVFGISGAVTVPEPATLGLLGFGVLGLLARRRRQA